MDKRPYIIRFGNDGWHARYEEEFTPQNVARVADALGLLWSDAHPGGTVLVGYDTRYGAHAFAQEVAGIVASHGLRARLSDVASPTPAIGWALSRDPEAVGGIVVTASERSCEYGGILVRMADGGPMLARFTHQLEDAISSEPTSERAPYEEADIVGPYLENVIANLDTEAIAKAAPKVVVDPMYGAGAGHLRYLLQRLGCEVAEIHAEDAPDFGGLHPSPADPWADECEQAVVRTGASLGLLLDGDADRAGVVDEKGRLIPPRELVPLILWHLVANKGERGRVVSTVTCSVNIERMAERLGCQTTSVPVGFNRIYGEMLEGDVLLGTEEYGGISIPVHFRERDGIATALLAVELVAKSGATLSSLVDMERSSVGRMCYMRRNVRMDPGAMELFRTALPGLNPGAVAGHQPVEISHADGLRLRFEDDSWVLVRPARSEPLVRVYAEAPTEEERDALLDYVCAQLRHDI